MDLALLAVLVLQAACKALLKVRAQVRLRPVVALPHPLHLLLLLQQMDRAAPKTTILFAPIGHLEVVVQ